MDPVLDGEGQNRDHPPTHTAAEEASISHCFSAVLLQKLCNQTGAMIICFHILSSAAVYEVLAHVEAVPQMVCPSTLPAERDPILLG